MATTALTPPSPEEVLPLWLDELQASDRAKGTIRRYKSAVESFLAWYAREEQRPLAFATLTPITLVGYRNEVQRTQGRATSTVNGHLSALRVWCAWLTEECYLEINPARRIKLVGRQEASKREGLSDTQANALLRQAQVSRDALRNYAIVQLLLQTGIRLNECSQLTLEDIEFGERSGRVTIRQGKGNKARTVPLNASARLALAEYLQAVTHRNGDPFGQGFTSLHEVGRSIRSLRSQASRPIGTPFVTWLARSAPISGKRHRRPSACN
jgi:site-specific recombinase XerD